MIAAEKCHMALVEYLHHHGGPQSLFDKDKVSTCTTTDASHFYFIYLLYILVVFIIAAASVVVVVRMVEML